MITAIKFFGTSLLAVLIGYSAYWWLIDDRLLDTPAELNWGLDVELGDIAEDEGYLYLWGTSLSEEFAELTEGAGAYRYNIATNELIPDTDTALFVAYDSTQNTSRYGTYYEETDAVGTADEFVPAYIDYVSGETTHFAIPSLWYESTLQVRPMSDAQALPAIVYDAKTEETAELDGSDISNWNVVIHDAENSSTVVIEQAVSPVWFNGGADVAYVQTDGVYRYNLAAGASDQMVGDWNNLPANTKIAIAPDSSSLVMVQPSDGFLVVHQFTDPVNGLAEEIGIIAKEGVFYDSPVFSPTSNQYAVQEIIPQDDGSYATTLLILDPISRELVRTIFPDFDFSQDFEVLDWRMDPSLLVQDPLM